MKVSFSAHASKASFGRTPAALQKGRRSGSSLQTSKSFVTEEAMSDIKTSFGSEEHDTASTSSSRQRSSRSPRQGNHRSQQYNNNNNNRSRSNNVFRPFELSHRGAIDSVRIMRLHSNGNTNHFLFPSKEGNQSSVYPKTGNPQWVNPLASTTSPHYFSNPVPHKNLLLNENNLFLYESGYGIDNTTASSTGGGSSSHRTGKGSRRRQKYQSLRRYFSQIEAEGGAGLLEPSMAWEQTAHKVHSLVPMGSRDLPSRPEGTTGPPPLALQSSFGKTSSFHQSFAFLFHFYVEGYQNSSGSMELCERLIYHPDAPSPAVLLYVILSEYRIPDLIFIKTALEAMVEPTWQTSRAAQDAQFLNHLLHPSASSSASHPVKRDTVGEAMALSSKQTLERLTALLKEKVPSLFSPDHSNRSTCDKIQSTLLECLVEYECFDVLAKLIQESTEAVYPSEEKNENSSSVFHLCNITPTVWSKIMIKASHTRVPHSKLLFLLLQMEPSLTTLNASSNSEVEGLLEAGSSSLFKRQDAASSVDVPQTFLEVRPYDVVAVPRRSSSPHGAGGSKDALRATEEGDGRGSSVFGPVEWHRLRRAEIAYTLHHPSADSGDGFRGVQMESYDLPTDDGLRYVEPNLAVGVQYSLSAEVAARLLLRCGVHHQRQSSPLLAVQILKRYVKGCEVLEKEASRLEDQLRREEAALQRWEAMDQEPHSEFTKIEAVRRKTAIEVLGTKAREARGAAIPHPTPFLIFFKIVSEAREYMSAYNPMEEEEKDSTAAEEGTEGDSETLRTGGTSSTAKTESDAPPVTTVNQHAPLPVVHWELAWFYFKLLNRKNKQWFHNDYLTPDAAKDLSLYVLQILMRGADPWMTLNVARNIAKRHIIDGVEVSLWFLHHIDVSHHSLEAHQVLKLLFRWLLQDVGIHLHPNLHHHLIPAARTLIQLHMQQELVLFYNAVIDNVFYFSENFKLQFMRVMGDLVCPVCQSILDSQNVYQERRCGNCMSVVAAQPPEHIPSFHLSEDHAEHLKEKRKQRREESRQRLRQNVRRTHSVDGHSRPTHRKPLDALSLFEKKVLSDATPLLPGVTVSSEVPLLPSLGRHEEGVDGETLDVAALHQEASRRMELHRQSRRAALLERGVDPAVIEDQEAQQAVTPSTPHHQRVYTPTGVVAYTNTEGSWVCLWCHGENSEWSSRLQCSSCGAQTGPSAPWREFKYAASNDRLKGDVMEEIRARIANSTTQPVDAVVAGFLLMLYKKAFKLRSVPHDYERLEALIERLCLLHERVLAGYLYVHLMPHSRRTLHSKALQLLAELFGGDGGSLLREDQQGFRSLTEEELQNPAKEEIFFEKVFTKQTCKVCFGAHDMKSCPIITRDFSAVEARRGEGATAGGSVINLSPEEKQKLIFAHLQSKIESAMEHGASQVRYVVDAYAAFVTSPLREQFSQHCSKYANQLSILLSTLKQYKRAAFVLCHVPVEKRWNEAYLKFTGYFGVSTEEAMVLLGKRHFSDDEGKEETSVPAERPNEDHSHPYFSQVTLTCCMCLDERHASAHCPNLHKWLTESEALVRPTGGTSRQMADSHLLKRLLAQADGWTSAGPERLFTFYRFLLDHTSLLHENPIPTMASLQKHSSLGGRRRKGEMNRDPFVYAINKTVLKLVQEGHLSYAYRLFIHIPPRYIQRHTTLALLHVNRFTEDGIAALEAGSRETTGGIDPLTPFAPDSAVLKAAAPLRGRCVLCCEEGHDVYHCPEMNGFSVTERCLHVIEHVASISVYSTGINAAATYLYHLYNKGLFPTSEALRDCYGSPEGENDIPSNTLNRNGLLVLSLLQLVRKCWAVGELSEGMRLLRRIPVEYVPVEPYYTELWKSSGLSETLIEDKIVKLSSLLMAEKVTPQVPTLLAQGDPTSSKPHYTSHFLSTYSNLVFEHLCRHCLQSSHQLSTCPTFHEEVSFGRDFVAAYRMSVMSEQLTAEFQNCYLVLLVLFITRHMPLMPYHIAGIANSTNALSAMFSFKGEVSIALFELLGNVYPQYRRRQVFRHVLNALQVPPQKAQELLQPLHFPPDPQHQDGSGSPNSNAHSVVAQHLLLPKPAIRDHAIRQVFSHLPVAMKALEEAPARMREILELNRVNRTSTNVTNAAALSEGGTTAATSPLHQSEREAYQKELNDTFQRLLAQYLDAIPPPSASAASTFQPTSSAATAFTMIQYGNIISLREEFEPLLALLEDCVGIKLGSRHVLFASSIDILDSKEESHSTATASVTEETRREGKEEEESTTTTGGEFSEGSVTANEREENFVEDVVVETLNVQSPSAPSSSPSSRGTAPSHSGHHHPTKTDRNRGNRRNTENNNNNNRSNQENRNHDHRPQSNNRSGNVNNNRNNHDNNNNSNRRRNNNNRRRNNNNNNNNNRSNSNRNNNNSNFHNNNSSSSGIYYTS